jgi:hypothetical protein
LRPGDPPRIGQSAAWATFGKVRLIANSRMSEAILVGMAVSRESFQFPDSERRIP